VTNNSGISRRAWSTRKTLQKNIIERVRKRAINNARNVLEKDNLEKRKA